MHCVVDLHSHAGLVSAPVTAGALELDSPNGPILPWLRSIDGLNTHDAAFAYAVAGGVTTVQVLPDSGHNAIGMHPTPAVPWSRALAPRTTNDTSHGPRDTR